jgi:hypothetical protein
LHHDRALDDDSRRLADHLDPESQEVGRSQSVQRLRRVIPQSQTQPPFPEQRGTGRIDFYTHAAW